MRSYTVPTVEFVTDFEDLAHLEILLGNADPLDLIPCFASYIDCI